MERPLQIRLAWVGSPPYGRRPRFRAQRRATHSLAASFGFRAAGCWRGARGDPRSAAARGRRGLWRRAQAGRPGARGRRVVAGVRALAGCRSAARARRRARARARTPFFADDPRRRQAGWPAKLLALAAGLHARHRRALPACWRCVSAVPRYCGRTVSTRRAGTLDGVGFRRLRWMLAACGEEAPMR